VEGASDANTTTTATTTALHGMIIYYYLIHPFLGIALVLVPRLDGVGYFNALLGCLRSLIIRILRVQLLLFVTVFYIFAII
jgi:hypothetical protein